MINLISNIYKNPLDIAMNSFQKFINDVSQFIPHERLISDQLRCLAYGTDASFYRLIPKLVIKVENETEVQDVIRNADRYNIRLTFRAAGTSLSGQAITDSVLVLLGSSWKEISVNDDATQITLQPGVIGAHANIRLARFNKKLGPDPASINSAKISGIAANNASGMTSGTKYNIYNTLKGMRIIFSDGSLLDTDDEQSKKYFCDSHPGIINAIENLSQQVKTNKELSDRISRKYNIKNTTGYGLNSLIDFDDPVNIILHLMIGSEGTLGFISDITLLTVPNLPSKATSLILFKDIKTACEAIPIFQSMPVDAAEIMDRAALRSVENKPGIPVTLKTFASDAAALLIETSAETIDELNKQMEEITDSIEHLPKEFPVEFTTDLKTNKQLWDVRKGLFPSVCKSRKPGTSVIIEDVNFPTERLADAAIDLQFLFKKYHYDDTIIWGHALSGNLHFVFAVDFSNKSEVARYKNFIDEVVKLVIDKYDGSLKAEHGTGRNMAPFVKYEWGEEAYNVMKEVKKIFDPKNILNPGVLINEDPHIHVKNLKPLPIANEIIDKCIECGFCEVNCPSKDLTLTPRQRIVVWREIKKLQSNRKDDILLNTLTESYDYDGNQTCATDGLCATSCPVDIDTGKLIKELRADKLSKTVSSLAGFIANNMSLVTFFLRFGLTKVYYLHKIFGTKILSTSSSLLRKISLNKIPRWTKYLPKGAGRIDVSTTNVSDLKVVYFPSCITRTMGIASDYNTKDSIPTVTKRLLEKAGYQILYPKNLTNLCCGMAFNSKGFVKQGNKKAEELINACLLASNNGEYPVLFDMSPCLYRMKEYLASRNGGGKSLKIYEQVEFINDFLIDKLNFVEKKDSIAIHVTCSSTKMDLEQKFINVAQKCAKQFIVPQHVGCCGFAGDRGFSYPELNKSALKDLKKEIPYNCKEGYSNSRTCEIGLSEHSGINYKSIVYLVDEVTS